MLRQLIVRDLGLKLLAFALAVAFWIQVAGQPVMERGIDVPLGFENVPELLYVGGDLPDVVRVRVRGAANIVSGLQPADVVAAVDLAGERPGRRRLFDMFAGRVRVPFGVEVTQVIPGTIAVALEPAGAPRTVTVVPDVQGRPAEGYAVGRISVTPETVAVVGPASRLAGLTEALTEPVSIEGAFGRVRATVTVGVADPLARLRTPGSAQVTIEIVRAPMERLLRAVPVQVDDSARAASFEPDSITVGVRGPRDLVEALDAAAVAAVVDLAGLRPGRYNLPVTVAAGAGIGVTRMDPSRVTVTVRQAAAP